LDLLNQPLPEYARQPISNVKPLPFENEIALKDVSFRYDEQTSWVLRNLNLNIIKGSKIGIIGTTGCGKSTLLDVIMGLLDPTEGAIETDGQSINEGNLRGWQAHIAHVPQTIFLVDSSIEANIAFGVPKEKIDHYRIRMAARQAQIEGVIENLPDKYQTLVGERGARLSGGQRQRIGIARALYKKAKVIIFDEATSSLDMKTELAIVESIEALNPDITILIIAHRTSTLRNCSRIIELNNGVITRIGQYQDMITS
jgi:ATP-binding cassette subfamily B protein